MAKYFSLTCSIDTDQLLNKLEDQTVCFLKKSDNDYLIGWGVKSSIRFAQEKSDLNSLQEFINNNPKKYIFGQMAYDVKNTIDNKLYSRNPSSDNIDDVFFFVPVNVIISKNNKTLYFGEEEPESISDFVSAIHPDSEKMNPGIKLYPKTNHATYIKNIADIKERIQFGDIYEMNYCTLFTAKFQNLHAATLFSKLSNKAKAPFSAYINTTKHAIVSASPERFIKKNGNRLTSQPIKGTAKRGKTNQSDLQIAQELVNNPKERAENIMIVDLVRNDLAKIADKKSVNVSELCGLYSFPTVHQLISTVTCHISNQINFKMMIEALFPMGSMTGAPKFSAMNIIEQTEEFRRGIYSGTIGYIEPNGNYDFNVIIRSLIVDKKKQSISAAVGGAITILSNPEDEYQETILKLNVLEEVLC